jgi:two-component system, NtrC family, response regulator AtoC
MGLGDSGEGGAAYVLSSRTTAPGSTHSRSDRLSGAAVWLPPLRDRRREFLRLAHTFLRAACDRVGVQPLTPTMEVLRLLLAHRWPGNVRELRTVMELAGAVATGDFVLPEHLSLRQADAADRGAAAPAAAAPGALRPIYDALRERERTRMTEARQRAGGNVSRAAELIGMPRRTFTSKARQYGIGRGRGDPLDEEGGD